LPDRPAHTSVPSLRRGALAARPADAEAGPDARRSASGLALTVLAWLLPAVLAFTLGRNRTTRFIMPLLPALAVLSAVLFDALLRRVRPLGILIIAAQLTLAVGAWLVLSFGGPEWRFGPRESLVYASPRLTERGPLTRTAYPLGEVVSAAAQIAPTGLGREALGMLLSDTIHVNQNTLSYAAVRENLPLTFGLARYGVPLDAARDDLRRGDFLLYQEGGADFADFTNQNAAPLRGELLAGQLAGWQLLPQPAALLPDGGVIRFVRRAPLADEGGETQPAALTPCLVLFGEGRYALVAYRVVGAASGLQLATVWLKLRPDAGRYAVAAHLVGPTPEQRFNADHHLPGGPAALAGLAVGQSLAGAHRLAAEAAWAGATRVELALYDIDAQRNLSCEIRQGPTKADTGWIMLPLAPGQ
jgi:hypothetical protein